MRQAGSPEWRVLDGVLRGNGGRGYAATCEEYGDFELFAELRATGAHARVGSPLAVRARPEAGEGEKIPGLWIACRTRAGGAPAGSVAGVAVAEPREARDGAWSTLRVKGGHDPHVVEWRAGRGGEAARGERGARGGAPPRG